MKKPHLFWVILSVCVFTTSLKSQPNFKNQSSERFLMQRLDSSLFIALDLNSGQWFHESKEVYTYSGTVPAEHYTYLNKVQGQWSLAFKQVYAFDCFERLNSIISYKWIDATSQWMEEYKQEYTYDSTARLMEILNYEKNANQWEKHMKSIYSYSAAGNNTEILWYYHFMGQWNEVYKSVKEYDANDNLINERIYSRTGQNQWEGITWHEFAYNNNGQLTEQINHEWEPLNNQWVMKYKEENVYDTNGNKAQILSYEWINNTWKPLGKMEYAYDNSYLFIDLILPHLASETDFKHKQLHMKEYIWDDSTSSWVFGGKDTLYYSTHNMSSVEESALATVQIFPNPASEYLQLDYPGKRFSDMQFELYDMQGRPVISKLVSSNEKISLHGIAKGMYIYRLMLDKTQQQGKILKQ